MPTFGSAFSGIGGLDLGLERAGWKCRWQIEIDDYCRRVLAKHWPIDVPKFSDIREMSGEELSQVDLFAMGFPCKQTSVAAAIHGRRHGLKGDESGLFYEGIRIAKKLRPKVILVENPAGAATWAEEIEGSLESLGYKVSQVKISAWAVGAPHLRRRVFWIANRHGPRLEVTGPPGPSAHASIEGGASDGNYWCQAFPGVLRVDDGVPGGLDRRERIQHLGESTVPQVAEWIGRQIIEIISKKDLAPGR